ncbi:MAG TPA: hypothetical protein VK454_13805 [Myxococcaceae bacterium]|nr:hypothetical protein [Myxococcaceae bacterium]
MFQPYRSPSGRPWPLSVVCLLGAALLGWTFLLAAGGAPARAFGPGYFLYLAATSAALGGALFGLWRVRPWGPPALAGALLVDDAVVAAMGELRPVLLAVQAAAVLIALWGVRRAQPRRDRPG